MELMRGFHVHLRRGGLIPGLCHDLRCITLALWILCAYVYIYIYICICVCKSVCVYIYIHIYIYIYIIYIYMYIYMSPGARDMQNEQDATKGGCRKWLSRQLRRRSDSLVGREASLVSHLQQGVLSRKMVEVFRPVIPGIVSRNKASLPYTHAAGQS